MSRVAQLLLSPKYYGVILAIIGTEDTYEEKLQTIIRAQQEVAQGGTVFHSLDDGKPIDLDSNDLISINF